MKPCDLYLGTEDGLRTVRWDGDGFRVLDSALSGETIRAIAPVADGPVYVGCGLGGRGLYRSDDASTFDLVGFEEVWVWDVTPHPTDDRLFVGTEPPMLYVGRGADSFEPFEGIDDLDSKSEWTFFHEPFGSGHVHGVGLHPDRPERIVAGVEHGALIYSTDGGQTWHERLEGYDVHRVVVDPQDPQRLFAAAGEGLLVSTDGGDTWSMNESLRDAYAHGITFDPHVSGRLFAYVNESPSPLFRSTDRGRSWESVASGLPTARPSDNLVVHPTEPDVVFYVGDVSEAASRVFVSRDAGETWTRSDVAVPKTFRVEAEPPRRR